MPITIDTTASALSNASLASDPKWFHSTLLTGNGGARGLINDATAFASGTVFPQQLPQDYEINGFVANYMNNKIVNGNVETNVIATVPLPLDIIRTHSQAINDYSFQTPYAKQLMSFLNQHPEYWIDILPDNPVLKQDLEYAKIHISPAQLQIRSDKTKGVTDRQLRIYYHVLYTFKTTNGHISELSTVFWDNLQVNTIALIKDWVESTTKYSLSNQKNVSLLTDTDSPLDAYLNSFTLYDSLSQQVELWTTKLPELVECAMDNYAKSLNSTNDSSCTQYALNVSHLCKYVSQYSVDLHAYKIIFEKLTQAPIPTEYLTQVLYSNLQLLLFSTLTKLHTDRDQLAHITAPNPAPTIPSHFTASQRGAITDESPLILTQAGAGTGKSTTLLARIEYMKECGVDPETITVLSFTNAGADNISEKNPRIQSMTIARMIHEIYAHNYPSHQLSTVDTLANSLFAIENYVSNTDKTTLKQMVTGLRDIRNNKQRGYMTILDIVSHKWDSVKRLLDETQQTTLELEIITAYAQINTLNVPDQFKTKHLIIDEVQDNSLFEFIYTLKYAHKFQTSLFMVGDGSQTLYEFRASNPKALNILEMTEYFSTHQLTTNYRSNQEVLDFANQVLTNIEANQFAKIQLTSNDLTPVTKQSFQEKIKLTHHRVDRQSDIEESILSWLTQPEMKTYIEDKLANGERVAFLSHKGSHVKEMERVLTTLYPQYDLVNLRSDRPYTLSLFSAFVKDEAETLQTLPIDQFHAMFHQAFSKYISNAQSNRGQANTLMQKYANILLDKWIAECAQPVANVALAYKTKQLTATEARKELTTLVLQCEIRHNAMLQSLSSQRSEERKNSEQAKNAPLIVSTIHSAKGLEFDNVVLLVLDDKLPVQEQMRMYYVGMTRAQKSEYILAISKTKIPTLTTIYDALLEQY